MTSEPAPPDPSSPLYKPTMYQATVTYPPANVQSNSTSAAQESPTDLLNSGLTTSGSGNGTSSGNGSTASSGSQKKSGAGRVSAVTGVLGISVAGFVGVLALL